MLRTVRRAGDLALAHGLQGHPCMHKNASRAASCPIAWQRLFFTPGLVGASFCQVSHVYIPPDETLIHKELTRAA